MDNKKFLGSKSYPSIVDEIIKKLQAAQADTLTGTTLLNKVYQKLNESKTPMMDVKEFITQAEAVASDDVSLCDVVKFCKKSATEGDLNYVINLCKEEHMQNLTRSGHPNPEAILKEIESEFSNPASIVEQGIKNGLYDRLNSKLLNTVKTGLNVKVRGQEEISKELNESYQEDFGGFCQYVPIGITYEDKTLNKIVVLTESDVLSYNKQHQEFSKLNGVKIQPEYVRLMEALNTIPYDPETEMFSLNENWDFSFKMDSNSNMFIGKKDTAFVKPIAADDFKKLLLESIDLYSINPTLVTNFNKTNFLRDADNMIMLMENASQLIKVDKLRVLRSLNENKYVLFDMVDVKTTNNPKVLSINGTKSSQYDSFTALCESVKEIISFDCKKLFESEIKAEVTQLNERSSKLVSLNEEQKELNTNIQKVQNMKKIAEVGSPAMDKLNEQERMLNEKLDQNIETINFYQNDFKLH